MDLAHRSNLRWFGLALAGTWVLAMFLPVQGWPGLALGTLAAGLVMLAFAGLGAPGLPGKGRAVARDIASGALGLVLGAVLIYFLSR